MIHAKLGKQIGLLLECRKGKATSIQTFLHRLNWHVGPYLTEITNGRLINSRCYPRVGAFMWFALYPLSLSAD
jgi:hypothetical protein